MRIAVIGAGNMGSAIISGFIAGGIFEPDQINVYDVYSEAAARASDKFGVVKADSVEAAVKDCDYVLMAVKPVNFDDCLKGVVPNLGDSAIVLSIAAAVTCSRIKGVLGEGRKFVRIMPNTPAQVGCGVSAVCPVGLNDEETAFVKKMFETLGIVVMCDENTLDAIGCLSGTGPAYVMLFIEALADGAVSLGIKRDDALKIAEATVMGSAKLALETGTHPAVLKDMVCSPAGTTIAGVAALEKNGIRNAAIEAVRAAYDRTLEMRG